jgi:hypothetical protein
LAQPTLTFKARPLSQESLCANVYGIDKSGGERPDLKDTLVTFECGNREGSIETWAYFLVDNIKLDYCYMIEYYVEGKRSFRVACGPDMAPTKKCVEGMGPKQATSINTYATDILFTPKYTINV